MTEAMPFLQKHDITFLRPPSLWTGIFLKGGSLTKGIPMGTIKEKGGKRI